MIHNYKVVNLETPSIEELYNQINEGYPVIVWATIGMVPSYEADSWYIQDGSMFTWIANEHCLVLIGYDTEKDTVILSDPYNKRGIVEYDTSLFVTRFDELGQQALVIKPI